MRPVSTDDIDKGNFFWSAEDDPVIACVRATGFAESKTGFGGRTKMDLVVFDPHKCRYWFDVTNRKRETSWLIP